MAPTHQQEEIEGRSYKEYAYSPVPVSSSSAVYEPTTNTTTDTIITTITTLDKETFVENNQNKADECKLSATFGKVKGKCSAAEEMAEKGSTLLQYVAAAAANLSIMATGAMLGWTSPILGRLKKGENTPLDRPITENEGSWVGSLVALGAAVGSFLAGYSAERFGRKYSLLFCIVPFTIGWVLIATATTVVQLYIARFIFGIALSFAFTVVPMYVGEIAETSIRGALGSFLQLFITFGLFYSYVIGPFVSYVVFWILCACLPVIFFVVFMLMPESPYYLISKGKKEEAIAALVRLRSTSESAVQSVANDMQAAYEESIQTQTKFSDLFTVKANLKALIFTVLLASFQQLTGINVVLFYMGDIFAAAKSSLDPDIATIIVGAVQIAASFVTPFIVDRLGRKLLLITSGIGEIVTLGALGLYFYLQKYEDEEMVDSIAMLPVISLVIFITTYCIGWGPLPWAVMGEMFAPDVKSKASGITVSMCWLLAFFITKFASDITEAFGNHTTYWMFGAFCLLSVLFTIFLLPETKGKSLEEIQDELSGIKPIKPEFTNYELPSKQ
ncbi:PREDICTED: facilitated trehalose transporter Tret1-2 homolog [Polistes canadensis]|uniref:facilitated trehalose transporter Tret1-2 homolog n=1 Tax=Polistes canadensis TaxID=91411 RepID=UPI000718D6F3|nr:PREDICTED: facilitated trehalose transporter Tret1-2 homolog [Polistes canadensis]